jgi:hypothetical protein
MSGGAQQPENLGLQPLHVRPSDDLPRDVELRSDDGSPPPICESDKAMVSDVDVDSESGDESVSIVILLGNMSLIQRCVKDPPIAIQSAKGSKPKANAKARSSSQPQCPCLCVPGGGMVQLVPDEEAYGWSRCTCVGCGPLSSGGGQRCDMLLHPIYYYLSQGRCGKCTPNSQQQCQHCTSVVHQTHGGGGVERITIAEKVNGSLLLEEKRFHNSHVKGFYMGDVYNKLFCYEKLGDPCQSSFIKGKASARGCVRCILCQCTDRRFHALPGHQPNVADKEMRPPEEHAAVLYFVRKSLMEQRWVSTVTQRLDFTRAARELAAVWGVTAVQRAPLVEYN